MHFINIEGLDGSGKSTQIKLLTQHLQKNNIAYRYLHFPRTDSPVYGTLIAKFLRGELGDIHSVNPYLVALIYAGDRNDAKSLVQKWMDEGHLILSDRYVYSNIAFQSAKLTDEQEIEELSDWIKYMEFEYNKIPRPDINLFLDVPFEFIESQLGVKRRGANREYLKGKEDIHEKDLKFQQKVRDIYIREVGKEDDFQLINCRDDSKSMQKPDEINKKILSTLNL